MRQFYDTFSTSLGDFSIAVEPTAPSSPPPSAACLNFASALPPMKSRTIPPAWHRPEVK